MGRKPELTELQRRVARERVAKGESALIAKEWGVAHTTIARASRRRVLDRIAGGRPFARRLVDDLFSGYE